MSDWKEIKANLFEHTNGNWVWRVGNGFEVWRKDGLTHVYVTTTGDRQTAIEKATK